MTYLSQRVQAMPRSGIRAIMDLTAGREDVIHLEVGQPDFRTPEHVVEAAVRAAQGGAHGYTPNKGIDPLREALASRVGLDHDVPASRDHVVVTCGAVNALYAVLTVLLDPGDAMLVPDPGWPNFAMMADLNSARAVRYPLDPSRGHRPDLERLEHLAGSTDRLRVLLVNSPNNPTGAVLHPEDVEAIVDIADRHDLMIVSDECYGRIVFDGATHVSPATLAPDRVALVTSVSKSYAMTGWRIGFLVAPSEIADAAAKVQEPVVACATTVSQHAAIAALTGDQSPVEAMVAAYQRRRDAAVEVLGPAGLVLGDPRGAFYVMVDIAGTGHDGDEIARRLVDRGVAVAPGPTFGPAAGASIRISLAASEPDVREGAERITEAIHEWSRP